ncbi:MAG: response regulator [Desulfobacteraceae bacterium]|nr:MAG: response regulator [Desulfobacteraceae bacterium]
MVKEVVKFMRASLPTSIEIRQRIQGAPMIMADATQIHQVLINLCTNASHAMTGERGRIEITLSPVTVSGENDDLPGEIRPGSYLKLMVTDNGSGIDPDISDRIFDPYFTTKDVGKGTGMGLAVVHGIIKNHNGHIFVDSEPGKGATFTILFPVLDQGSSRPDPTPEDGDANLSGKGHILFVDDEISLAELSKKIIESMGYTVEQYSNPRDALAVFRHSPERFDLLISDMTMPVMSGLDLANQIKEIRSDLPVIICTGHSSAINEEQSAEAGIDAFALKPITRSEIGHLIKGVLGTSD